MRVGRLFMVLILALSIAQGQTTGRLTVTVGKSLIIDSPVNIQRVSVANHELAESVLVTPKEVLINAKKAGETTVVIEQENGNRLVYDVTIRQPPGH